VLAVSIAILVAGWMCLPVRADIPASEYITVFLEPGGRPYTNR